MDVDLEIEHLHILESDINRQTEGAMTAIEFAKKYYPKNIDHIYEDTAFFKNRKLAFRLIDSDTIIFKGLNHENAISVINKIENKTLTTSDEVFDYLRTLNDLEDKEPRIPITPTWYSDFGNALRYSKQTQQMDEKGNLKNSISYMLIYKTTNNHPILVLDMEHYLVKQNLLNVFREIDNIFGTRTGVDYKNSLTTFWNNFFEDKTIDLYKSISNKKPSHDQIIKIIHATNYLRNEQKGPLNFETTDSARNSLIFITQLFMVACYGIGVSAIEYQIICTLILCKLIISASVKQEYTVLNILISLFELGSPVGKGLILGQCKKILYLLIKSFMRANNILGRNLYPKKNDVSSLVVEIDGIFKTFNNGGYPTHMKNTNIIPKKIIKNPDDSDDDDVDETTQGNTTKFNFNRKISINLTKKTKAKDVVEELLSNDTLHHFLESMFDEPFQKDGSWEYIGARLIVEGTRYDKPVKYPMDLLTLTDTKRGLLHNIHWLNVPYSDTTPMRISMMSVDKIAIGLMCGMFELGEQNGSDNPFAFVLDKKVYRTRGYISPSTKQERGSFHGELAFCWAPINIKLIASLKMDINESKSPEDINEFLREYKSEVLRASNGVLSSKEKHLLDKNFMDLVRVEMESRAKYSKRKLEEQGMENPAKKQKIEHLKKKDEE
jgi:hypothetical protein